MDFTNLIRAALWVAIVLAALGTPPPPAAPLPAESGLVVQVAIS